jgi:hypothetical protein
MRTRVNGRLDRDVLRDLTRIAMLIVALGSVVWLGRHCGPSAADFLRGFDEPQSGSDRAGEPGRGATDGVRRGP